MGMQKNFGNEREDENHSGHCFFYKLSDKSSLQQLLD